MSVHITVHEQLVVPLRTLKEGHSALVKMDPHFHFLVWECLLNRLGVIMGRVKSKCRLARYLNTLPSNNEPGMYKTD